MNARLRTEESRLIAEVHAAVLNQAKETEFEAGPYERATELLESLSAAHFVDDRVRLALDITRATRNDCRPDLSRRALYAAFPAGSELTDMSLRRKWFTFAGVIEAAFGNVDRSLKYKLIALDLSEQLNDSWGFYAEWVNFSNLAGGAGHHHDAVRYATLAIDATRHGDPAWLDLRGAALFNRANSLMRLGRFAESKSDLFACLTSITHPPSASVRNRIVFAQYVFAELELEIGDRSAARAALSAAATWADVCGVPQYKLQIERVRARLEAFEFGMAQAVSKLQELLEQAYRLQINVRDTSFEDVVLDVLYTLEQVHREHGDVDGADRWLNSIGEKLRKNATKMLDALVDKPLLADETTITAKMAEIDKYLQSRSTARSGTFGTTASSWSYLIGLAASASSVEDATKEHGVRVARLAGLVAQELALPDTMQRGIDAGCLVHDIGKASVPSSILLKQTPLDAGELQLYENHPSVGAELIERSRLPEMSVARNVIRFHHHSYQGSSTGGSPEKGEAIPLEARIASVCDRYDSLITGRPRQPAVSSSDALREIFGQRSRDFDPNVVDIVIEVVRRLQRSHRDVQAYLSEEADNMEYFAMQRTLKRAAERALMSK